MNYRLFELKGFIFDRFIYTGMIIINVYTEWRLLYLRMYGILSERRRLCE